MFAPSSPPLQLTTGPIVEPTVTVVCPIYNDADICGESIQSVLNQDYPHFKLIIFDNGSTDRTREVIQKFEDHRITLVQSPVNLKSEIMANLLWGVKTKYISQIYSDDIFETDKLRRSISRLEESGADVCFSNNSFIDDDGRNLRDDQVPGSQFLGDVSAMTADDHLYRFYKYGNSLHPVAMVIRSDAYRSIGGVRPYLHSIGDMEFFARVLLHLRIDFIRERLQKIRIKTNGRSNESAPSRATYLRVVGERMRFYDVLNSDAFLERIDKVFFPKEKVVHLPKSLRRWFLGQQIIKLGDPDCRFYGMNLLYQAMDENFSEIDNYLVATTGYSASQFIENASSTVFSSGSEIPALQEVGHLRGTVENLAARLRLATNDFEMQRELVVAKSSELRDVQARLELAKFDFFSQQRRANSLAVEVETLKSRLELAEKDFANQLAATNALTEERQIAAEAADTLEAEIAELRSRLSLAEQDFQNQQDANRLLNERLADEKRVGSHRP